MIAVRCLTCLETAGNCSDNNIEGEIGALPLGMWVYDVRNNRMSGGLPLLSMFHDLEVFVASGNQLQGGIIGERAISSSVGWWVSLPRFKHIYQLLHEQRLELS